METCSQGLHPTSLRGVLGSHAGEFAPEEAGLVDVTRRNDEGVAVGFDDFGCWSSE
ncbi:hypothetical protein RB3063 [Rhodopirellula baltica SH 1]|uniref:Uncharacterized protein n=1 Tax=Rhodopirellula baltica (strain DSM 10527 / NCIMB 13988 / SH1) TaxID=243090 RepID=Q7UUT9_RHOBA|nr:hypothetical protein RB3063 [Rhodopirellula baltica SH 1]